MGEANFRVGDKVIFNNEYLHNEFPKYYPQKGTIGTILTEVDSENDVIVEWPAETVDKIGVFKKDYSWYANISDIKKHNFYNEMTNKEIYQMLLPKFEKNRVMGIMDTVGIAYRSGYLRATKGRPFKYNVNGKDKKDHNDTNCKRKEKNIDIKKNSSFDYIETNGKRIWFDKKDDDYRPGDAVVYIGKVNGNVCSVWPKFGTVGVFESYPDVCTKEELWVVWDDNYYAKQNKPNKHRHCWSDECKKIIKTEEI